MILLALISVVTSFIGSFLCFVLWVHFDLDAKWEERKYQQHKRHLNHAEFAPPPDPTPGHQWVAQKPTERKPPC